MLCRIVVTGEPLVVHVRSLIWHELKHAIFHVVQLGCPLFPLAIEFSCPEFAYVVAVVGELVTSGGFCVDGSVDSSHGACESCPTRNCVDMR